MKALQIRRPDVAEVVDVADPVPGAGEVLVEVEYAAVCSTDRRLVQVGTSRVTPGHEVSGRLPDGTPVGIHPDTGCGDCPHCAAGHTNRCIARRAVGIDIDGGFAERIAVPAAHAVPVEGIALDLVPLLEPLACALHAARRLCAVPRQTAVVVGAGAMGILATWALQALGLTVHVCQRGTARRELAAELGADGVLAPEDDVAERIGRAPDVAIVTAPGAEAIGWALERVAEGGRLHAFAGSPGGAAIDANLVHYRHLDLVGSTGSGLDDYRTAINLVRAGAVDLSRLPRRETDLDHLPGAIGAAPAPRVLRSIVRVGRKAR